VFRILLSSSIMLLAELSIENLKKVSSKIWNGPLDSSRPWFYYMEVIGSFEDFHVHSVSDIFFFGDFLNFLM
jgi:hypothetical protein